MALWPLGHEASATQLTPKLLHVAHNFARDKANLVAASERALLTKFGLLSIWQAVRG